MTWTFLAVLVKKFQKKDSHYTVTVFFKTI